MIIFSHTLTHTHIHTQHTHLDGWKCKDADGTAACRVPLQEGLQQTSIPYSKLFSQKLGSTIVRDLQSTERLVAAASSAAQGRSSTSNITMNELTAQRLRYFETRSKGARFL